MMLLDTLSKKQKSLTYKLATELDHIIGNITNMFFVHEFTNSDRNSGYLWCEATI